MSQLHGWLEMPQSAFAPLCWHWQGLVVLPVWYSYLCELGTLSWWLLKKMRLLKTKVWLLNGSQSGKTVNSMFGVLFIEFSWKSWCKDASKYPVFSETWKPLALEPWPGSPSPLCLLPVISLQYWCHWHHMQLPTSPTHHPVMSHDVILYFGGKPMHMCPNLGVEHPHSEHVHLSIHTQPIPTESEVVTPGAHHDALPQVPWHVLVSSLPG